MNTRSISRALAAADRLIQTDRSEARETFRAATLAAIDAALALIDPAEQLGRVDVAFANRYLEGAY